MRLAIHCRFSVASARLFLLATSAFGQVERHCEIAGYFDARPRLVRIAPQPVLIVDGTRISDLRRGAKERSACMCASAMKAILKPAMPT
jgi:hypothetical protein